MSPDSPEQSQEPAHKVCESARVVRPGLLDVVLIKAAPVKAQMSKSSGKYAFCMFSFELGCSFLITPHRSDFLSAYILISPVEQLLQWSLQPRVSFTS